MPPKSNSRNVNGVTSGPVHYARYTSSFSLPLVKGWKKHFSSLCKEFRLIAHVLNTSLYDTPQLSVTTNNTNTMNYVEAIVQKEIAMFLNTRQKLPTVSKLPKAKKQPNNKIPTVSRLFETKTVNRKKTMNRPKWVERYKQRKRTKTIAKCIQQQMKYNRRHQPLSLNRQLKRSPSEYRQKVIIGRRRDRTKARLVQWAKKKFSSNRDERKFLFRYKSTTTYGSHTASQKIAVVKKKIGIEWPTELLLTSFFGFPKVFITSVRSSSSRTNVQILFRYYNQCTFIYAIPTKHSRRPSKKYLIKTISTVNNNFQAEFFPDYQTSPKPAPYTTTTVKPRPQDNTVGQSIQSGKQKKKRSQRQPKKR